MLVVGLRCSIEVNRPKSKILLIYFHIITDYQIHFVLLLQCEKIFRELLCLLCAREWCGRRSRRRMHRSRPNICR